MPFGPDIPLLEICPVEILLEVSKTTSSKGFWESVYNTSQIFIQLQIYHFNEATENETDLYVLV
jgi:hypothetical protein